MVPAAGKVAMTAVFAMLGEPRAGGMLIVGDHASNHVPVDVGLGIDPALLDTHIAFDIGVSAVAARLVETFGFAAFLSMHSRLVVDLNRHVDNPSAIPTESDGIIIPGNHLDNIARKERLARFHVPYHDALEAHLALHRPALIVSLHSFTPMLETRPDERRPWDIGVLYSNYEIASKIGIRQLIKRGLFVGDQEPYSGKFLNATMTRHAEPNAIPYWGVEMNQGKVSNAAGQGRFAILIGDASREILEQLA